MVSWTLKLWRSFSLETDRQTSTCNGWRQGNDVYVLYIYIHIIYIYPLVMTNIALDNPNHKWRFRSLGKSSVNGPSIPWLLNNQRVYVYIYIYVYVLNCINGGISISTFMLSERREHGNVTININKSYLGSLSCLAEQHTPLPYVPKTLRDCTCFFCGSCTSWEGIWST